MEQVRGSRRPVQPTPKLPSDATVLPVAAWPIDPHAIAAGAGVALAIGLIAHLSLWYDEFYAVSLAAQGPAYILKDSWASETNPPLYYLILWFWTEILGRSEAAVRALSVLAYVGTIPIIVAIARKLGLGRSAWAAAALFTLSAEAMQYADMARMYALWTLAIAAAILALAHGVEMLKAPAGSNRWRCARPGAAFALASVVALYVHDLTIVFVAAAELTFLVAWLAWGNRDHRDLIAWIAPQLAGLILAAPQLAVILAQTHSVNIGWIPRLSAYHALAVVFELIGGPPYPLALLRTGVVALTLAALLAVSWTALRRRSPILVPVILTWSGFALLCLLSVWRPVLLARTAVWLLVPLALIGASALEFLGRPRLRWAAFAAAAMLCAANAGLGVWMSPREPWRDFVKVIAAQRQPSDVIVLMSATPVTAFLYYDPASASWDFRRWQPDGRPKRSSPHDAGGILENRILPAPPIGPDELMSLLRAGRGVWLVSRLPTDIPLHGRIDSGAIAGVKPTVRLQRDTLLVSRLAASR